MFYDVNNALGAVVFDVEAKQKLDRILSVDTGTGEVKACHEPLRLAADGENVDGCTIHFSTIYPIFGGRTKPVLFHCYGRIE